MKVICAGFPKTGTKSLKTALEMLGYSVYDYSENMFYFSDEWKKIMDCGWSSGDFQSMYQSVDAVCDAPACYFWDEILKAFPDAKVILSTRKREDDWVRSTSKQLEVLRNNRFLAMAKILSPTFGRILKAQSSLERVIFGLTLEGWGEYGWNEEMLRKKYREHNSYVINNTPAEKLLNYRCEDGWEPLCEFLGLPKPNLPFPHKNKNGDLLVENMDKDPMLITIKKEIIRSSLLAFASTVIAGFFASKYVRF